MIDRALNLNIMLTNVPVFQTSLFQTLLLDTSEDLEEEARRQFEAENTQEKIRGDF